MLDPQELITVSLCQVPSLPLNVLIQIIDVAVLTILDQDSLSKLDAIPSHMPHDPLVILSTTVILNSFQNLAMRLAFITLAVILYTTVILNLIQNLALSRAP